MLLTAPRVYFKSFNRWCNNLITFLSELFVALYLSSSISCLAFLLQVPAKLNWESGVEALKDALRTEAKVTKSIRQVIAKCEDDNSNNDYHVCVDLLRLITMYIPGLNDSLDISACRLLDR